jgi:DedD protein
MAWFKFGKQEVNLHDDTPIESVESMRNRAKYRLIGSVVLVAVGVIGFPMLFDSQPRTVAVDIPIEIPDKAKTKPIGNGVSNNAPSAPAPGAVVEDKVSLSGKEEIVATAKTTEKDDKKTVAQSNNAQAASKVIAGGAVVAAGAVAAGAAVKANADKAAADKTAADKAKAATDKAAADKINADKARAAEADKARKTAEADKAKVTAEASRAKALLEGEAAKAKPAATVAATAANANPPGTRYIVQFGSYAEPAKAQEVRQKVEKTGLKTYSQVAKTPEGERIRVRVGPFTSQAEADKAAAKIKALDLPAAILTL